MYKQNYYTKFFGTIDNFRSEEENFMLLILINGDPFIPVWEGSNEVKMLNGFANILTNKELRNVSEILIVNYYPKFKIDDNYIKNFLFSPKEDIKVSEGIRIEKLVKCSNIISKSKFLSKTYQATIKSKDVVFLAPFFPYEFISIYNNFVSAELLDFYSGEKFSPLKKNDLEMFFECSNILEKELGKLQPDFENKVIEKTIEFVIENIKKDVTSGINKSDFPDGMERVVNEVFPDAIRTLLKRFFHNTTYELKTNKHLNEYYANSIESDDFFKLFVIRYFTWEYIKPFLLSKEGKRIIKKFIISMFKIIDSEIDNSMVEEFYDEVLNWISNSDKLPDSPEFNEEIDSMKLSSFEMIPNKNSSSEYFYQIFDNSESFFADLQSAHKPFFLFLGNDPEMVEYTIEDSLRNSVEGSIGKYDCYKNLDLDSLDGKQYLIVKHFDELSDRNQIELWTQLQALTNKFTSIILSCSEAKYDDSLLSYKDLEKITVPSFYDLKENRYKIFLYLFNKIKMFDKNVYTKLVTFYFHFHCFDYFFNQVISFEALDKIVNELTKQFEFYLILDPIFWFHFMKENIEFTEAERKKKSNTPKHKEEYRIELKGDFWEVNYGYFSSIHLSTLAGFNYLFNLLKVGGKVNAEELYKHFSGKKSINPYQVAATIRKGRDDAIRHLKEIEDRMNKGNAFSNLLQTYKKTEDVNVDYVEIPNSKGLNIKVIAPEGYFYNPPPRKS